MIQDTSSLSWVELQPSLGERQALVYHALLQIGSATDMEVMVYLGKSDPNYVRPRRKELYDLGVVRAVEKRKCNVTGRTVYAWEVIKQRW